MELTEMFGDLKKSEDFERNSQLISVLLNSLARGKKSYKGEELGEIKSFALDEMKRLLDLIPQVADYKQKEKIFGYQEGLFDLFDYCIAKRCDVGESEISLANTLLSLCKNEQVVETAVTEMFELPKIDASDIEKVLAVVRTVTDEYYKGSIYQGLLHFGAKRDKLTDKAKQRMAEYIAAELERYLSLPELSEDQANSLEIAADACKFFTDKKLSELLQRLLSLKSHNNVRFYAVETQLFCKQKIDGAVIAELAADLVYADMTYALLKQYRLTELFPQELCSPEYLAKSDMVHWLIYPTELGKAPDAIELIGSIKAKGARYYVFKFKSNSDTLDDQNKNVWLIGWASEKGGTFSSFDRLADFEQRDERATLKLIKKKLLG